MDRRVRELEEQIARDDLLDDPEARWRAADALFEKAEIVAALHGDDVALPLYEQVAERLQGRREPGPHAELISALNAVADVHFKQRRYEDSEAASRAVVEEHLHCAPREAASSIAIATVRLARLLRLRGERLEALATIDALVVRLGQMGVTDVEILTCDAVVEQAEIRLELGQTESALEGYSWVVEVLSRTREHEFGWLLASALARLSGLLASDDPDEARRLRRRLIQEFATDQDPDVVNVVAWARQAEVAAELPSPGQRWRRSRGV